MRKSIFIAPVYGIKLTNSVNNEFQIIRTLLVTKEKLQRNRKKFGIPEQISKLPKFDREKFFDTSDTFAIVQSFGTKNNPLLANKSLKTIQRELSILTLSHLQYKKRGETSTPTVMNLSIIPTNRYAITKIDEDTLSGSLKIGGFQGRFLPLTLDEEWNSYQRKNFFFNLLSLFRNENKKLSIDKGWLEVITKACILIGESQNSYDLKHAFLWNMIALEVLITKDDNKFLDILPKRIEAFFGWLNHWKTDDFAKRIQDVYRKRVVAQEREKSYTLFYGQTKMLSLSKRKSGS